MTDSQKIQIMKDILTGFTDLGSLVQTLATIVFADGPAQHEEEPTADTADAHSEDTTEDEGVEVVDEIPATEGE